jgi:hypothetical protein
LILAAAGIIAAEHYRPELPAAAGPVKHGGRWCPRTGRPAGRSLGKSVYRL